MVRWFSRRSSMPFCVVASALNTASPSTRLMSSGAPCPDLWPGTPKEVLPCFWNPTSASRIGALLWKSLILLLSSSGPLEIAGDLPVGDAAVILRLLPSCSADVVVDDRIAEGGAQHARAVKRRSRLAQRARDLGQAFDQVG